MFGSYSAGSWIDMAISAYTDKFSFRPMAWISDWNSGWSSGHAHRKFSEKEKERR